MRSSGCGLDLTILTYCWLLESLSKTEERLGNSDVIHICSLIRMVFSSDLSSLYEGVVMAGLVNCSWWW